MKRKHRHKEPFPDDIVRMVGEALFKYCRDYPKLPPKESFAGWKSARISQFTTLLNEAQDRGKVIVDEMGKRDMMEYLNALKPLIDSQEASRVQQIEFIAAFFALTWDHFAIVRDNLGINPEEETGIVSLRLLSDLLKTRGGLKRLKRIIKKGI